MIKRQVTATVPAKDDKPALTATITINDGETAAEQIQMFGDEAVKSNASSNWDVTLQAAIRSGLKRGEDQATIQERLGSAKMGVKVASVKVDPVQAYMSRFASATPDEQKKMLAELQKRVAKAPAAATAPVK